MLLLLSCATFGKVCERAVTNASLIELIHTASLAHDDVVDEADSRRGELSAPARWGNKFAVLLGDYLLARTYELSTIDGDLTKPDAAYVESRKRVKHANLIRIREDFREKILASVTAL